MQNMHKYQYHVRTGHTGGDLLVCTPLCDHETPEAAAAEHPAVLEGLYVYGEGGPWEVAPHVPGQRSRLGLRRPHGVRVG